MKHGVRNVPPNSHIYCRRSKEERDEASLSLDTQEAACRAHAGSMGWPVATVHRDEGVSGDVPLASRPGLSAAVQMLGPGDKLIVLRTERLVRADDYTRGVIYRAIAARGAELISTHGEGTGGNKSSDVVFRGIVDVMSYGEKLRIAERTREALDRKRHRGERTGQVPYGWRLAGDGVHLERAVEDDASAELARRLRAEGRSYRAIAAELAAAGHRPKMGGDRWADSSVRRLLGEIRCRKTA